MLQKLNEIINSIWPDCPYHIRREIKLDPIMSVLSKKPCIDIFRFDGVALPKLLPGYDPDKCNYKDKSDFSMNDACDEIDPRLTKIINQLI